MNAVKKKAGALDLVRGAYDYDGDSYDSGIDCSGYVDEDGVFHETPSLAKQSSKDECDINVMMARYQTTGVFENVNQSPPRWGDFSDVPSYQAAQNLILDSQRQFASLDAVTRARFGNDPAQMLAFLNDEKNRDEAMELGLVARPSPEPDPTRVVIVGGAGDSPPPEAA